MTVWRDIRWAALRRPAKEQVRVAGLMVMLNMGDGQPVALGEVAEANSETLLTWLLPLAQQYGEEVIVTDG